MILSDWFELTKLGFITFYHIVIRGHHMEIDESINGMAVSCSCGYYTMVGCD